MEHKQFNVKHEENTLTTEPQGIKCEIKTETEEYDNLHKNFNTFSPVYLIETKLEVKTENYENESQNEQQNTEESNVSSEIIERDVQEGNFGYTEEKPNPHGPAFIIKDEEDPLSVIDVTSVHQTKTENNENESQNEQQNTEQSNVPYKIIGTDVHEGNFDYTGEKPNPYGATFVIKDEDDPLSAIDVTSVHEVEEPQEISGKILDADKESVERCEDIEIKFMPVGSDYIEKDDPNGAVQNKSGYSLSGCKSTDLFTQLSDTSYKQNICSDSNFVKNKSNGCKLRDRVHFQMKQKRFKCFICDASFPDKFSLMVHIRTHPSEKPFNCKSCNMDFCRKSDLNRHERSHDSEKPFPCNVCGKSFSRKYQLSNHIRTHTRDKPYKCSFCSTSFTQKCNLGKHVRNIHTYE